MPRKNQKKPKLTARQGKCLRFVVSRTTADAKTVVHTDAVKPAMLVSHMDPAIYKTDLPKTIYQASSTLSHLAAQGLIERTEDGFVACQKGIAVISSADAEGLWRS